MSWKFMDQDDNNITKPTDTEWPFKIMNFEIKINYYKKELGVINLCFKFVHSHFPSSFKPELAIRKEHDKENDKTQERREI